MPNNRSSRKKRKKVNNTPPLISFKDTCLTLNSPEHLQYSKFYLKTDTHSKKGRKQSGNFRITHKRDKHERYQNSEYINIRNAPQRRYQAHHKTFLFLELGPLIIFEKDHFVHKNTLINNSNIHNTLSIAPAIHHSSNDSDDLESTEIEKNITM